MKIGESVKAVLLPCGTIQCLSASDVSIERALDADKYRSGKSGKPEVQEVVILPAGGKTVLKWVVVCEKGDITPEIVCDNRSDARYIRKFDKEKGYPSYIERREYQLISSKKVS